MPENTNLQQRAGRNIGTEAMPPFINGGAMPEIAVNPTGMTVIMEGQEGVVRTPCVRADASNFGFLLNRTNDDLWVVVLFVDNENNEMLIGSIDLSANNMAPLALLYYFLGGLFLGLCPGEKIILRSSIVQPQ